MVPWAVVSPKLARNSRIAFIVEPTKSSPNRDARHVGGGPKRAPRNTIICRCADVHSLVVRDALGVQEAEIVYVIDGGRVEDTTGFYTVLGEAVNGPGGYFGQNLDSLNDCLRGGFGTPEDMPFRFVWSRSEHSRLALGYPETVRQLEVRLAHCHPTNRVIVQAELAAARRSEGQTVFDWLVGIFMDQQVRLELQ